MNTNFEPSHSDMLDDSFHYAGGMGGGRGGMGGGMMGGGMPPRVAPVAPAPVPPRVAPIIPPVAPAPARVAPRVAPVPAVAPARMGVTPQQRHNRMVARYYRHHPYGGFGHRAFRISPFGWRWFNAGSGYLYGYPYTWWYPFFYDLSLGIYDEEELRSKYNLSDQDWNSLMFKLQTDGYIFNY